MSSSMKNLVIVESPAKAKTISKYLGKDFQVLSSVGHIRSIPTKTKTGVPAVDTANDFKTIYEIDPDKKKVVTELKKAVKQAETVWLATDEDREGEAIAWHLCETLKLDPKTTNRIAFHEITQDAITEAINNPRTVDMQLVEAQQARQILDRLVGFELSPVIWRKVPGGKSAGRVQSPAVRLIVEREQEVNDFEASFSYKLTADLTCDSDQIQAELNKKLDDEPAVRELLEKFKTADFTVSNIETKPSKRNPSPPFTTSTLQQTANARLGYSSKTTMALAQKLYQAGKITYMRTDSLNLSQQIISSCKKYIIDQFGAKYHHSRNFKTKAAGAQEAHEAIRPTNIFETTAGTSAQEQKLYDLIRNRTLATQMAPAEIEKTIIKITISNDDRLLQSTGEVILFKGFLAVEGKVKEQVVLPRLEAGDRLDLQLATAKQVFQKPPARYTEGSLVKKLEELGIGRPSTYATIIDTIQKRGYVERGLDEGREQQLQVIELKANQITNSTVTEKTGSTKGKLVPTSIGGVTNQFLRDYFDQVVNYDFTAEVEEDFDKIAAGKLARNQMLHDFYTPFHQLIEESGDIKRSDVAGQRELGIDPKTKKTVYARIGRFGPMVQLGDASDEQKPQFAPMPKHETVESVSLEQALEMFKLPRLVGQTRQQGLSQAGLDIKANIGRFGPYIQVEKLFVSIKPHDPHKISLEEAQELYEAKLEAEAAKNIADFGEIKVLKGRYGPYVTDGKINATIPKKLDPTKLTEDEAKELLAAKQSAKPKTKAKPTARKAKPKAKKVTKKAAKK